MNLVSHSQVLEAVERHPALQHWASKFSGAKMKAFMPAGFMGVLTLTEERYGEPIALSFFNKVETGANLAATDPAHVLRERFISKAPNTSIRTLAAIGLCVKAVNAHIKGLPVGLLRMGKTDQMPELI